jgi:hypothetical protein
MHLLLDLKLWDVVWCDAAGAQVANYVGEADWRDAERPVLMTSKSCFLSHNFIPSPFQDLYTSNKVFVLTKQFE